MRFFTVVLAPAILATQVLGHPASTSRRTLQTRVVDFNSFRLSTVTEYSNFTDTAVSPIASLIKRGSYIETATAFVQQVAPGSEFRLVDDHYVGTNGISHVNFKQTIHGLDIDNADFNVNIARDGSIFSYGNSVYSGPTPQNPLLKRDQVGPIEALKGVSDVFGISISTSNAVAKPDAATEHYTIEGTSGAYQDPKARLVYIQTPENSVTLTWRVETDLHDDWILSYIDALSAKSVVGVVNYVADASYQVYPWGTNDPKSGSRTLETNPYDSQASEFTWQGTGSTTYTTTRGNNGIAQANYEGDSAYLNDYRPTATGANFNYDFNPAWSDFKKYSNASVTQIFYTANVYHDLLHVLGFNEAAGNFETDNNGAGGRGNDAVILDTQDGSRLDNAQFSTPPDGSPGRMSMYMWTGTPQRDSSFDAGVVIHEYTHGLSNRLTGGPANSNCLSVLESGGMGEGWGDFMAIAIHVKTSDTRGKSYPMGDWISNKPAGIRAYLYSTSLTTNPLTYKSVNGLTLVHPIGTVWATMLYEVLWNLIEKYGINSQRKPTFSNGIPTDGRFLAMKLVVDGMALQPCSPTFVQARDAIIDADKALTGGSNACELWKGFAKRGLGQGAARGSGSSGRSESYVVPSGIC